MSTRVLNSAISLADRYSLQIKIDHSRSIKRDIHPQDHLIEVLIEKNKVNIPSLTIYHLLKQDQFPQLSEIESHRLQKRIKFQDNNQCRKLLLLQKSHQRKQFQMTYGHIQIILKSHRSRLKTLSWKTHLNQCIYSHHMANSFK